MGCSKSSSKREVYNNTILPQKNKKNIKDNLTLHLKQLEKEQQQQQNSRRKGLIKTREEINERNNSKD